MRIFPAIRLADDVLVAMPPWHASATDDWSKFFARHVIIIIIVDVVVHTDR